MTPEEQAAHDIAEAKRVNRLIAEELKFVGVLRPILKRIPFEDRNTLANMTGRIICGIYDKDEMNTITFVRQNRERIFAPYRKRLIAEKEAADA